MSTQNENPQGSLQREVRAPVGFRLLVKGEYIRKGDIYSRGGSWHETRHTGGKWNPDGYWPMARRANVLLTDDDEQPAPSIRKD